MYHSADGEQEFTRVPWEAALQMTRMDDSLVRSKGKQIYMDHKMCNPRVQPGRATTGVRDATYHRQSMPSENWDNIVGTFVQTERVMSSFVLTSELRKLIFSQQLNGYKTMTATFNG